MKNVETEVTFVMRFYGILLSSLPAIAVYTSSFVILIKNPWEELALLKLGLSISLALQRRLKDLYGIWT